MKSIITIVLLTSLSAMAEPYPNVGVISKERGWKQVVRSKEAEKDVTWVFEDAEKLMQASDLNGDGVIDYLRLQKPIHSFHHSVWTDTDYDGFFDKRAGSLMKLKIKAPKWSGAGGGNALTNPGDDTLQFYLGKSDLVVMANITTMSGVVFRENVPHYACEINVTNVLKGNPSLKGNTLGVSVVRFEMDQKDQHPLLKKDSECIFFLKKTGTMEDPAWQSADMWFAIQRPSASMATALTRLSKEDAFKRAHAADH